MSCRRAWRPAPWFTQDDTPCERKKNKVSFRHSIAGVAFSLTMIVNRLTNLPFGFLRARLPQVNYWGCALCGEVGFSFYPVCLLVFFAPACPRFVSGVAPFAVRLVFPCVK